MMAEIFDLNITLIWEINECENIYGGVLVGELQKTLTGFLCAIRIIAA